MAVSGGFGVTLQIKVTDTLTTIAHVLEVEFPEFEKVLAESTGHDSPGGYAEFVATGKRRLNPFVVTLGWDPDQATHAAIQAAFDSDDPVEMSILDPAGGEPIPFQAHVMRLSRIAEQEDLYKCEVEIQPTGQPTAP